MGIARLKNLAGGGIKDYYAAGKDDYYDTEDSSLQLAGTGIERYDLEDSFNADQFEALNMGENGHHRKAKDLTLSPPKSISLLFALGNTKQSEDAVESHRQAVRETIDYIEHSGMITTRVRTEDRVETVPASGIVVPCFEHGTNRNQDPNLHSHCLIANACTAQGSETITNLNYHAIYRNQKHLGQVYDSALINALTQRGYSVRPKGNSFELEGIDDYQLAAFSTRKRDIEQNLAANNKAYETATDDERQRACFATRRKKETREQSELALEWQERANSCGLDLSTINPSLKTLEQQTNNSQKPQTTDKAEHLREAIKEASEFDGIFTAKAVYARAITKARESGQGLSPREARRLFEQEATNAGVISIPDQAETSWIKHEMTTVDLVEAEMDFCQRLKDHRGIEAPALPLNEIETGIAQYNHTLEEKRGFTLKEEQAQMVRHILENRDLVSIVQGDAGTGKTTALDAVATIFGRDRIKGLALQSVAAKNLENETGIPSSSIDQFLKDIEDNSSKSKNTIRNGLIVVDEAAMVDSRKMNRLSEIAEQYGAKLCLVGDTKQLAAVGAGQPMELAMDEGLAEIHYLSDIRRQQNKNHLEAVKATASGEPMDILIASLAEQGIIKEYRTKESRHRAIAQEVVNDWNKGIHPLVITSLNKDRESLNAVIRHELQTKGLLPQGQDTELNLEGRTGELTTRKMAKGDVIVFNRNDRRQGIENGNLGIVQNINPQSQRLVVRMDKDGTTKSIDLGKYRHIDHAYAVSTYKSQGQTVTKCIYDANSKSPLLSKNEFYVGISRHKEELSIYTDNTAKATVTISREKNTISPSLRIFKTQGYANSNIVSDGIVDRLEAIQKRSNLLQQIQATSSHLDHIDNKISSSISKQQKLSTSKAFNLDISR